MNAVDLPPHSSKRPFLAHPARSAYACLLVFSARTGLIGKDSNGSIAAS